MDLGIKDRVAIVTGGSRGLGRMSALSMARKGVKVSICGRTQSTLDSTVAELTSLGVSAAGIAADLAEPESARKVFEETQAKLGPVDILVNNVGGRKGTTIVDTTDEQLAGGFNMNLWCALRFMKFVIPGMKERKWGRIINITSIHGREYWGLGRLHGCQGRPHRHHKVRRP